MDTDAITTLLRDVSAEVIDPRFRALQAGEVSEKAPGDLVTVADHEAEVLISRELRAAFPGALVLGEEAVAEHPDLLQAYATAEHAFIIDPVDGTKNFVNGSPDHAVMAAELRGGTVVRGWIYQPQHGPTGTAYVAELGSGAFRDGVRLQVADSPATPAEWRGVSARRRWVGCSVQGLAPLALSWASCGVDYPRLIAGAADYLLYYSTKPWDHAPGGLLLTEAGGVQRTPDGAPYDPTRAAVGGLVAATSAAVFDVVAAGYGSLSRPT